MRPTTRRITSTLLLILAVVSLCWAETHTLVSNGQQKTYTLKAKDKLDVVGNLNAINVGGQGDSVNVMGNENTLVLDAQVRKIDLMGNGNNVKIIQREGRKDPSISQVGNENRVTYEKAK